MSSSKEQCPFSGVPHRALQVMEVLLYEYDELGLSRRLLQPATMFQPWPPLALWRGHHVPVTLGGGSRQFEWGRHAPTAHFLRDDDFFERCAMVADTQARARPRLREQTLACPFAPWPGIAERLRLAAGVRPTVIRHKVDELLGRIEDIRIEHTHAAESQRDAEGFDNRDAAAKYAGMQDRLLAQARELLSAARNVLR